MLGTGSRQILVTFYQVPTCQRFSLTPLQGVANLLSAQRTHSPMATPQHGSAGLCSRQHPHQSILPISAQAPGRAMGCGGAAECHRGMLKPWYVTGGLERCHTGSHAVEHSLGRLVRTGWK